MDKNGMSQQEMKELKAKAEKLGLEWRDIKPRSLEERWKGNPFSIRPREKK